MSLCMYFFFTSSETVPSLWNVDFELCILCSLGQAMVGVEGKYSPRDETTNGLTTNQIDVELGETHSHNTAAVKQKNNKQFIDSTDMSVKKKCCTIL